MSVTVAEYLQRHNPVYRRSGRWVIGSESRQRTFAAVKEVLLAGGGEADFPTAVALTVRAAPRHGAETKDVWRLVRRYRDRLHYQAEQLELPFPRKEHRGVRP